jgi:hypothetical protein
VPLHGEIGSVNLKDKARLEVLSNQTHS